MPYMVFSGVLLLAAGLISLDMFFEKKRIEIISAIYFGLLVGMLLTFLLSIGLGPLLKDYPRSDRIMLLISVCLCLRMHFDADPNQR